MSTLARILKWAALPAAAAVAFLVFAAIGDATSAKAHVVAPASSPIADAQAVGTSVQPSTALAQMPRPAALQLVDNVTPTALPRPNPPSPSASMPPVSPLAAGTTPSPSSSPARVPQVFGLDGPLPLPFRFRFIDPCAGPGATPPACGAGTGGTILPLLDPGTAPDPLQLGGQLYDISLPADVGRCTTYGTTADAHEHVTLFTNNPAHLAIRFWASADPAHVITQTFDTTDTERGLWTDHRVAGDTISPWAPNGVQNCLDLVGMTPGTAYSIEVTGTDDLATTDVRTYGLMPRAPGAATGHDRPPTTIIPVDGAHAKVIGTLADAEQFWVAELPRNTPDHTVATCTSVENAVLTGHYAGTFRVFNNTSSAITLPTAATYPYDRRFHLVASEEWWPDEGERATICTWITTAGAHSFDLPVVQDRTAIDAQAPRRRRVRVSIVGGSVTTPVTSGSVQARIEEYGFLSPGVTLPAADAAPGALVLDAPITVADSAGLFHPDVATLAVTTQYGTLRTALTTPSVACPTDPALAGAACPSPSSRLYHVQMKGPRIGSGMCGSSFGSCDPPHTDTFLGDLTIAVDTYDGPSGPPTDLSGPQWNLLGGSSFPAGGGLALPEHVQLDLNTTQAGGGHGYAGHRPDGTLRIVTDRPVRVTAHALGWTAGSPCGGQPQTDATLGTIHSFRWTNLCFGTEYEFVATVTDSAGTVTGFGDPGGVIAGYMMTDPLPIANLSYAYNLNFHSTHFLYGVDATAGSVIIAGRATGTEDVICHPATVGTPTLGPPQVNNTAHGYPITLPESVPVSFTIDVGTGDYCEDMHRVVLTGHVPLAQLVSGTPVTLTSDDPLVGLTVQLSALPQFPIVPT